MPPHPSGSVANNFIYPTCSRFSRPTKAFPPTDEVILKAELDEGGEAPEDVSLPDLELVTAEVQIMVYGNSQPSSSIKSTLLLALLRSYSQPLLIWKNTK